MRYKWWVIIAAALFITAIIAGAYTPPNITLPNEILDNLKQLSRSLAPYQVSTAVAIFVRNLTSLVSSFIFSPLLLFVPMITLLVNGWLIGFVTIAALDKVSIWYVLAGLLPHGIFELPAIIIGEAAAFSFGSALILALFVRERRPNLKADIIRSLKFMGIACALLVPAAIIETFVTPMLIGR
jgi:stage II sporulation protein M